MAEFVLKVDVNTWNVIKFFIAEIAIATLCQASLEHFVRVSAKFLVSKGYKTRFGGWRGLRFGRIMTMIEAFGPRKRILIITLVSSFVLALSLLTEFGSDATVITELVGNEMALDPRLNVNKSVDLFQVEPREVSVIASILGQCTDENGRIKPALAENGSCVDPKEHAAEFKRYYSREIFKYCTIRTEQTLGKCQLNVSQALLEIIPTEFYNVKSILRRGPSDSTSSQSEIEISKLNATRLPSSRLTLFSFEEQYLITVEGPEAGELKCMMAKAPRLGSKLVLRACTKRFGELISLRAVSLELICPKDGVCLGQSADPEVTIINVGDRLILNELVEYGQFLLESRMFSREAELGMTADERCLAASRHVAFNLLDYSDRVSDLQEMRSNGLRLLSVVSGLTAVQRTELRVRLSEGRVVATVNLLFIIPIVVAAGVSVPIVALVLWMRSEVRGINLPVTYSQAMAKIKNLQSGGKCNCSCEGSVEVCITEEGETQHLSFEGGVPAKRDELKELLGKRSP